MESAENASKFTPKGGRIQLQTRCEGDTFVMEISDTGVGIDAHALPYIFESFVQGGDWVTREFGGLGLARRLPRQLRRQMVAVCMREAKVGPTAPPSPWNCRWKICHDRIQARAVPQSIAGRELR